MISFIEDNELGVYTKEIIVQAPGFVECVHSFAKTHPTLYGVKEVFGPLIDSWKNYYTHESQDAVQRAKKKMNIDFEIL